MAIERHQGATAAETFRATTDFLECECGAVIAHQHKGGIVECGSCKATNFAEDLADARVEEIVAAVEIMNKLIAATPEANAAEDELERAKRAFQQNPTPAMSTVVRRLASRVRYLRRRGD